MGKLGSCWYQVLETGIQFYTDKGKKANKIEYQVAKVVVLENFFTVMNAEGEIHLFKIKQLGNVFAEEILPPIQLDVKVTSLHLTQIDRFKIVTIGTSNGKILMVSVLTGEQLFTCDFASDGPVILCSEFSPRSITDPSTPLQSGTASTGDAIIEVLTRQYDDVILVIMRLENGEVLIYKSFGEFPNRFERMTPKFYISQTEENKDKNWFTNVNKFIFVAHPSNSFWITVTSKNTVHFHVHAAPVSAICPLQFDQLEGYACANPEGTI